MISIYHPESKKYTKERNAKPARDSVWQTGARRRRWRWDKKKTAMEAVKIYYSEERCVVCGDYVPEGRMVCLSCERKRLRGQKTEFWRGKRVISYEKKK